MAGGKDGSFGASVGSSVGGLFKKKEDPKEATGIGPGTTTPPS